MRWGFLGAGGIARNSLAPAVRESRTAVLRAAAARDPARARALGAEVTHGDYAALLADPTVDVVYVALHNSAHREWTAKALRAGKHVVCEKPMGLTAAEVAELASEAAAAGKILVEACWNRWHPRTRALQRLLGEGALGTVREVRSGFRGGRPPEGDYRHDPALGGGALYDVGCYAIACALLAFDWRLPAVRAARQELGPTGVDETTTAELVFPDGVATIESSLTGQQDEWFSAIGDKGSVELSFPAFTGGAGQVEMIYRSETGTRTEAYPPINPYTVMVDEVSAASRGREAFLVGLGETAAVAEVIDSIRASARRSAFSG
ncbi:Gfo/Idh/MocA family protein [Actinosynnema sp.]|uniref:Gfo/Idh/MocA family protein n=1 Tax=Actinosynnema sp. TaxID=1872144 RepID=UPI003F84ADD4